MKCSENWEKRGTSSAQENQGRLHTEDDTWVVTECGGFKICPQIFGDTSFQEVGLNSPPLECGLDLMTHLLRRPKWQCVLFPRLGYQEHCDFLLTLFLGSLTWEESAAMSWGCSCRLMKRTTWQESQASWQQQCEGAILAVSPPVPTKMSNDFSQHLDWNCMRHHQTRSDG